MWSDLHVQNLFLYAKSHQGHPTTISFSAHLYEPGERQHLSSIQAGSSTFAASKHTPPVSLHLAPLPTLFVVRFVKLLTCKHLDLPVQRLFNAEAFHFAFKSPPLNQLQYESSLLLPMWQSQDLQPVVRPFKTLLARSSCTLRSLILA